MSVAVIPLSSALGAEITGARLARPNAEGEFDVLRRALLDDLFAHQLQPEFRYRHHWRSGDLVIWDNRSVNHRACGGYDDNDIRLMHRTTVLGDAPH